MNKVDHPSHYSRNGIECIEYTVDMSFTLGNALKYIWRAGLKGDRKEDLLKALKYLEFDEKKERSISIISMTEMKIENLKLAFQDDNNIQAAAFAIVHADCDVLTSGRSGWREMARNYIEKELTNIE